MVVIGLLDCWVIGLLGYWVIGLLGYWVVGLLGYWVIGLSDGFKPCIIRDSTFSYRNLLPHL